MTEIKKIYENYKRLLEQNRVLLNQEPNLNLQDYYQGRINAYEMTMLIIRLYYPQVVYTDTPEQEEQEITPEEELEEEEEAVK